MRKGSFNSIIVKDKDSDKFVFIRFENGKLDNSYYKLSLPKGFIPEEEVNHKLPVNKMILSSVKMKTETELSIIPKFSIELKIGKTSLNFWHMLYNPDYLIYLLTNLQKRNPSSLTREGKFDNLSLQSENN